MSSAFETVYKEVLKFKTGAYCYSSDRGEIDTPFHSHDKGQFVYTEKGTLHIATENNQYFLPVKHFIWIPRGVRHRMWTNNSQVRMFTIYFDQFEEHSDFFKSTAVYMVNNLLYEMVDLARQWSGLIGKSNLSAYRFLQGLKAVLPQISKANKLPLLGFVKPYDERLQEIIEYMKMNLENKLELKDMAVKFGISQRSLSRSFNAEGTSFIEYLQALRIVKSMELLAEKKLNINMVASKVGYESITAFSNVFKRFTGERPIEYVKNMKK